MLACLAEGVASVTATSNNATIYSIPSVGFSAFTEDLPVSAIAEIVSDLASAPAIDIPVAVGFCMLISRPALDAIGGFDKVFGKGYGEEEDWSLRAREAGFANRLAVRAFVFHEGGVSMSAAGVLEKGKTTHDSNAAILEQRYPERRELIDDFLSGPAMKAVRLDVIDAVLDRLKIKRRRVLHWLHANPLAAQAGGTERAVKALVEGLDTEYFHILAFPSEDGLSIIEWANGLKRHLGVPVRVTKSSDAISTWRRVAAEVIALEDADLMHFHHGYGTAAAAPALGALDAAIPLAMTLHDFNLICPRNHLFDRWGAFCGVPSASVCAVCVSSPVAALTRIREVAQAALNGADVVFVADQSTLDLIGRAIALPDPSRIEVRPPPSRPLAHAPRQDAPSDRHPNGRVVIAGRTEAYHKGQSIFWELVSRLSAHGAEVHSIGASGLDMREGLIAHGEYGAGELEDLLRRIDPDIAVLPSVSPETYSFMLSELWRARIPVVAADLGAIGGRIRSVGGGLVVASATAGDLAEAVLSLLSQPELMRSMRMRLGSQVATQEEASTTITTYSNSYKRLIGDTASLLS
jgi:glycosyltransferase involved in cell wall biosynthesis